MKAEEFNGAIGAEGVKARQKRVDREGCLVGKIHINMLAPVKARGRRQRRRQCREERDVAGKA